jgi:hypothetical protein
MLPAKQFPLSQYFFMECIATVRDNADKDAGYVYKESCHIVNLDVSSRQSLLLWPLWGECLSIFWNSLKMDTARAKVTHPVDAVVHCDFGHTESGGENVDTAKRICNEKDDVMTDTMTGYYHSSEDAPGNLTQGEAIGWPHK